MASRVQWGGQPRRESDASTARTANTGRASCRTCDTTPTEYSLHATPGKHDALARPLEGYYEYQLEEEPLDLDHDEGDRASISTCASTTSSEDEEGEQDESGPREADYQIPHCLSDSLTADAISSTPQDFASLFPSRRRMSIRHDDSTLDGNMNLRVDTDVTTRSGRERPLTLFHLRMHDLKSRDFSLRRYCRDSGREVCHTMRKYETPVARPTLPKSLSSALATIKKDSRLFFPMALARSDSGYASIREMQTSTQPRATPTSSPADTDASAPVPPKRSSRLPTNTIKFEFSNYAQLEVKRRGTGTKKRYEFSYWGISYHWRRDVKASAKGRFEEASYHLMCPGRARPIAHVVPQSLSFGQAREERLKGGWVPPCSLWLSDEAIIEGSPDVADVIVATGLIALVDDQIKRRWHSKATAHGLVPRLQAGGPKSFLGAIFSGSAVAKPVASRRKSNGNGISSARPPLLRRLTGRGCC